MSGERTPGPGRPPRQSRRARERSLRRRRLGAVLVVLVVAGGLLALLLAFTSGKSEPSAKSTAKTTTAKTKSHKPTKAQIRAHKRLELKADQAAQSFVEAGYPVYCGGGKKKLVALTFDDGPSPYTKGSILHVLAKRHARATFFVVGRRIADYPGVIQAESRYGVVGDHTWNHSLLTGLNLNAVKAELGDTQSAIEKEVGKPVRLFRPPYGSHDAAVDNQAIAYGMVEVLWSVDSLDWQGGNWKTLVARVLDQVRPGSIVLMHDIHPNTVAATWKLVPALHHLGYRLVTIPEMLALDPPSLEQLQQGIEGCAPGAEQTRGDAG